MLKIKFSRTAMASAVEKGVDMIDLELAVRKDLEESIGDPKNLLFHVVEALEGQWLCTPSRENADVVLVTAVKWESMTLDEGPMAGREINVPVWDEADDELEH